jgi:hypothetical protein
MKGLGHVIFELTSVLEVRCDPNCGRLEFVKLTNFNFLLHLEIRPFQVTCDCQLFYPHIYSLSRVSN